MRMIKRLASALTAAALLTVPAFASAQTTTPQPEPSRIDASVTTPPSTTTAPVSTPATTPTTVATTPTTSRQITPFAALTPQPAQIVTKCDYRSGASTEQGPYANNICWLDFGPIFSGAATSGNAQAGGTRLPDLAPAATSAGQPVLVNVGGPRNVQLTFNLKVQTVPATPANKQQLADGTTFTRDTLTRIGAYSNVMWKQQFWGNPEKNPGYYLATDPSAQSARPIIGASKINEPVVFRFDNITIYEDGVPLTRDYSFVMADAESVNANEEIGMVADTAVSSLALVNPAGSNRACSGSATQFGTSPTGGYFNCVGGGSSASAFYVAQALSPKTVEAAIWRTNGAQGFAVGLGTSAVEEQQKVEAVTLPDTGARDDTTFTMNVQRAELNGTAAQEAPLITATQQANQPVETKKSTYLYDGSSPVLRFTSRIDAGPDLLNRAARYGEPQWTCYSQAGATRTPITPTVTREGAGGLTTGSVAAITTTGPGDYHCEVKWPVWQTIGQVNVAKQLLGDASGPLTQTPFTINTVCTLPPGADPRRYTQAFGVPVDAQNRVSVPVTVRAGQAAVPVYAPVGSNCTFSEAPAVQPGTTHTLSWRVDSGAATAGPTVTVQPAAAPKTVTAINTYAPILTSASVRRNVVAPADAAGLAGASSPVAFDCGTRTIGGTTVRLTGVVNAGSAATALPASAVAPPAGVTAAQLSLPGNPGVLAIPAGNTCTFSETANTVPAPGKYEWTFAGATVTATEGQRADAAVTLTAVGASQVIKMLPLPATGSRPYLVLVTLLSAALLLAVVVRNFRR
ncbi:DUF5979 domain-containing protein [Corynebacterium jeddahense]|uniref:DUF5979 domain-containing protein n=1 Tax=Corynebacterium jeddahense TaxID=1414719 RepID=A0ABY7ULU2_9CORY|nr:DUF5979 domain-containing protein [Corynebacterium jeddahense]WCZ39668.1 hypothetical protein CJEDD_10490 [Corynebacterium jeddahense]